MGALDILLLDDDDNTRRSLSTFLRMHGHEVATAARPSEALAMLGAGAHHVLLTDVRMPEMDGIQVIGRARALSPDLTVIVMTAYGDVKDAVRAMQAGAFDYLTKPLDEEELIAILGKAAERHALIEEVRTLRRKVGAESPFEGIIGTSAAMGGVYDLIRMAAGSEAAVLITGETGSGKEVAARAIHRAGARAAGPLVTVSCGALPETLLESELFGHVKGAFTGAVSDRAGKIRTADGGTLFLDEVGTLSPSAQAKLLRCLEEKKCEPLGGDRTVETDIRVIAATNEDLARAVGEKRFRKDLYYRLNVLQIEIPPLRKRKEDIPLLARHFLGGMGRPEASVSSEAMSLLLAHDWPGNVRELEHVIERGIASMRGDVLTPDDLPPAIGRGGVQEAATLGDKVAVFEKNLIEDKLRETGGNVARAALELREPIRTLRRKIKRYGIRPRKKTGDAPLPLPENHPLPE
ncbi:MAG: sigma-54 dependent transcriptional regulator [bacterium]|nr:sigma-54 dependent transcriptional regulator [bacterium]